jgi:HlyD family secretion protein
MNRRLTRGISAEKISSPEQLDQAVQVIGPMYWAVLGAVLVAIVTATVWSLVASIPTKATGEGIIVRPGGLDNVVAGGTGFLKSFDVKVGDHVRANQTIAVTAENRRLSCLQQAPRLRCRTAPESCWRSESLAAFCRTCDASTCF